LFKQRHEEAVAEIAAVDGLIEVDVGSGGLQGDKKMPEIFVRTLHSRLTKWMGSNESLLFSECPIHGPTPLGACSYADDVCDSKIVKNEVDALEKAISCKRSFASCLAPGGFAMNEKKTEHQIKFHGKDSAKK
jgi:hypothetical protein